MKIILLPFLLALFLLVTTANATQKKLDDEEMRLMYKAFIFSKDLPHAYKIAKKALKVYPKSLFWHEKMGEVALWSNKSNEAMNHITYLYNQTQDKHLADKLIQQLLATYQYKKALPIIKKEYHAKHTHNKDVINIYDKIGKPEEAIQLLKKRYIKEPSSWILATILALQLDTGMIDEAKEIVPALEKYKNKDVTSALALSKYYFLQKDLEKSYQVLREVKSKSGLKNSKYFGQLSDLAWYLNDKETAAYASRMLYKANKAREIDYKRLQLVYLDKDLNFVKSLSQKALQLFKSDTFMMQYLQKSLDTKQYDSLQTFFNREQLDENSTKILEQNPKYWLIKASVHKHFKEDANMQEALKKALTLTPDSIELNTIILWSLIDNFQYQTLNNMVSKIEKRKTIPAALYHPLAAAYLTLQKPDIAMMYLDKTLKTEPETIDLQFLRVEILAAQGRDAEKKSLLRDILNTLDTQSKQNPKLLKDKQFLRSYLQAYMEFTSPKKFMLALEKTKPYLSKKDLRELQILSTLKVKNYKKAQTLYHDSGRSSPQFEMEMAYLLKDKKKVKQLIEHYALGVPQHIKLASMIEDDKIQEAIQETKSAIQNNQYNPALKAQLAYLHDAYTHHMTTKAGYYKRGALTSNNVELENFYYVAKGYGILSSLHYANHSSSDKARLAIKNQDEYDISIGLRKQYEDSAIEANIAYYHDKRDSRYGMKIKAHTNLSEKIAAHASIQTGARVTDQSIYMRLAGNRDTVASQVVFSLTPNHQFTLAGDLNNYFDNTHLKIGDGIRTHIDYTYLFSHYPLSSIRFFYEYGNFSETGRKGKISQLLSRENLGSKLLQNDYSDAGIGLHYGADSYTFDHAIHPFFDIAAVYSGKEKRIYTMLEAGLSGNHSEDTGYKLSTRYQNSINGLSNEEFGAQLHFKKYY